MKEFTDSDKLFYLIINNIEKNLDINLLHIKKLFDQQTTNENKEFMNTILQMEEVNNAVIALNNTTEPVQEILEKIIIAINSITKEEEEDEEKFISAIERIENLFESANIIVSGRGQQQRRHRRFKLDAAKEEEKECLNVY